MGANGRAIHKVKDRSSRVYSLCYQCFQWITCDATKAKSGKRGGWGGERLFFEVKTGAESMYHAAFLYVYSGMRRLRMPVKGN